MRTIKDASMKVPLKIWDYEGGIDDQTIQQMKDVCKLDFVQPYASLMADGHYGSGSAVGAVVPVVGAIPVATVGVDLGCGMIAVKTSLTRKDIPTNLKKLRASIEKEVPAGRTDEGGVNDRGSWHDVPPRVIKVWETLVKGYEDVLKDNASVAHKRVINQLGTLGTGNHFVELCTDEQITGDDSPIWIMLHSGSRGIGNKIGSTYIGIARNELAKKGKAAPNRDLAFLEADNPNFDKYVKAASWAQDYAAANRALMVQGAIRGMEASGLFKPFTTGDSIQCHHNYISQETHFGNEVLIIRKGAVRAQVDDIAIIPGNMGQRSFIVRGRGNPASFNSCSHGAGRTMSRTEAKKRYTTADLIKATEGVECLKTPGVIDEIPMAYKPLDLVMKAQADLVDIDNPVAILRQFMCIKGEEDAKKRERGKYSRRRSREDDVDQYADIDTIL